MRNLKNSLEKHIGKSNKRNALAIIDKCIYNRENSISSIQPIPKSKFHSVSRDVILIDDDPIDSQTSAQSPCIVSPGEGN